MTPALCAHRGLSHACPENTLPAFASALTVGAQEIELDARLTKDGVPVVCHDETVDRTTNGKGAIRDLDWSHIRRLDAGSLCDPKWRGVRMPSLEEVLELVAGRAAINLHVKDDGDTAGLIRKTCDLVRKHHQSETVYLALESAASLTAAVNYAPEIARCCLVSQDDSERQIAVAKEFGCARLQFFRQVTARQIEKARNAGLVCNLFWSDEIEDALGYLKLGIDVVLTNCAHHLLADGFFERRDG